MENTVHVKSFAPPPVCEKEILRYAGIHSSAPDMEELVRSCISEAQESLVYRVCYLECQIEENGDLLNLGFAETDSSDLRNNLSGCERIILFAATVGIGLDKLISKYSRISPTKAVILQAIGAERIESLCDVFCSYIERQVNKSGYFTRPRFSAGYGDLPLGFQRNIFSALDCARKIGVTLNDSLIMSPSKSVTGIIGISKTRCEHIRGCKDCNKEDCGYRR